MIWKPPKAPEHARNRFFIYAHKVLDILCFKLFLTKNHFLSYTKNNVLKQIVPSANGLYQEDFLKVAILNCSTKGAITGAFRRASHLSIAKKVSKVEIVHGMQILQGAVKI